MFGNYRTKKILLLGSGELGKEVAIEAQRLGVEVVAVDAYDHAPAMHVAHRSHVIDMLDAVQLRHVIEKEKPDFIVPEIEAIATEECLKLEEEDYHVIPTAKAAYLTMNREGIRRLASEKLDLPTANYRFAETLEQLIQAVNEMGMPCVVKPIMSSSGKGQSVIKSEGDIEKAWQLAQSDKRGKGERVIIEQFVHFESEITLLTVRAVNGTFFCPPIGHIQQQGDYVESWQPHPMSKAQLDQAQEMARKMTEELGGYGLFGVELFLTEDGVIFSEISPRPHDTGMVTMVSQDQSEFALHVRAILGYPVENIEVQTPSASAVIKAKEVSDGYRFTGMEQALQVPSSQLRLFGKPITKVGRRMGVALAKGNTIEQARDRAKQAANRIQIHTV
ncbi:formate-dependent phosphoribosylglycinamide formyltransferase [Longirhabdus pacifica]|uniref:formate-dependent phosphoribosylglycinamide formyltransferase n=1 Tax=Longirhabdus pacifica TaxID=2305227 RepID=UPI00100921DE|nr:formate-dependent phosphoribosylglycinamide formyltransferase [Longirhabdus pacifica]